MSSLVIHVLDPRFPGITRLDSYGPCRFLADPEDLLQWTSSQTSLLSKPRTQYWLWSIVSPKWPISPLVPSRSQHKRQLSQFWMGLSGYMDSPRKLCPTEALNLHPSSSGAYSSSLELTFGYPQLSTPRHMDKPNGQTRYSSNTFAAL
jgi:hypothetical protein